MRTHRNIEEGVEAGREDLDLVVPPYQSTGESASYAEAAMKGKNVRIEESKELRAKHNS